jgi:X-Pro dipeptidyl-peptidase-like protein
MQDSNKRHKRHAFAVLLLLLLCVNSRAAAAQQSSLNQAASAGSRPVGNLEDWTSLSLQGSELIPERPLLGEHDDNNPKFTRELWQVKWRQGDPIDLYVIRPKGVAKPPAILYLYSYPSETDIFRNDDYCERVTDGGFAAIGFVSALTGQRYTNRPMKEWFVSELQEALSTSVHDVQLVLNYLSTRDDLDMNKVGMFGVGSGGTIAILSAAADRRIKTIDVIDPWGDWPDWMANSALVPERERPNYVKPEFLKKVAGLDPVLWLPRLKTPNIRLQQVMDDSVTPRIVQDRIRAAARGRAKIVTFATTAQLSRTGSKDKLLRWIKTRVHRTSLAGPAVQDSRNSPAKQARYSDHDD